MRDGVSSRGEGKSGVGVVKRDCKARWPEALTNEETGSVFLIMMT